MGFDTHLVHPWQKHPLNGIHIELSMYICSIHTKPNLYGGHDSLVASVFDHHCKGRWLDKFDARCLLIAY